MNEVRKDIEKAFGEEADAVVSDPRYTEWEARAVGCGCEWCGGRGNGN